MTAFAEIALKGFNAVLYGIAYLALQDQKIIFKECL